MPAAGIVTVRVPTLTVALVSATNGPVTLAEESGVASTVDPVGGAYAIEEMTDRLQEEAEGYLARIEAMAGRYRGKVHFTCTDHRANLPADYTFVAGDNGQHVFTVTLKTSGKQTITVTDTATCSITGNTDVTVTR